MSTPVSPVKIYRVQYAPRQSTRIASPRNAETVASEILAKNELGSLLNKDCPEAKHVTLTSPRKKTQECLLVNANMDIKPHKLKTAIPLMDSLELMQSGYLRDLDEADTIQIEHAHGHILNNSTILKRLNPFKNSSHASDGLTSRTAQKHPHRTNINSFSSDEEHRPGRSRETRPLHPDVKSKKPETAKASPSIDASSDDDELMFDLEL